MTITLPALPELLADPDAPEALLEFLQSCGVPVDKVVLVPWTPEGSAQ